MPTGYVRPRPWTAAEDADLVRYAKEGYTVPQIAMRIGRRKGSVVGRMAKYHGDILKSRRANWRDDGRNRDRDDALRIRVYEAALGRTRQQLAEAMPDVAGRTVDRILEYLSKPSRTTGNWLPAVLAIRDDGVYVREKDRDMGHGKQPRTPGIRRERAA